MKARRRALNSKKKVSSTRPLQLANDSMQVSDLTDVTPIVEFLEMFRMLSDPRAQFPSKLISIKIPEPLLAAFKFQAQRKGIPYQTLIKQLMVAYLKEG